MSELILTCKAVKYNSFLDEDAFFYCIKKIKSIIKHDGRHDELYLYFNSQKISNQDLKNLIGLFHRYKIKDMKQLQIFLSDENQEWFADKKKYWFFRVFGKPKK